jgi:chromobox protein 5
MIDGQEEYAIDKLLRQRDGPHEQEIEVKWKGWTDEHNTWEPRSELLKDVPQMVAAFDSRPRRGRPPKQR